MEGGQREVEKGRRRNKIGRKRGGERGEVYRGRHILSF